MRLTSCRFIGCRFQWSGPVEARGTKGKADPWPGRARPFSRPRARRVLLVLFGEDSSRLHLHLDLAHRDLEVQRAFVGLRALGLARRRAGSVQIVLVGVDL